MSLSQQKYGYTDITNTHSHLQNLPIKGTFCYNLAIHYGLMLKDPPSYCDGYEDPFDLHHKLSYKEGGLVVAHHKELRNKRVYISTHVTTHRSVYNVPMFDVCCGYVRNGFHTHT